MLAANVVWSGVWLVLFSFTRTFVFTAVTIFFVSMTIPVVLTTANGLLQILAPPDMRSRLLSIYLMISFGAQPIAALLIGVAADAFTPMGAILLNGILMIVAAVALVGLRSGLLTAGGRRPRLVSARGVVNEQPDDDPPSLFPGVGGRASGGRRAAPEVPRAIVGADPAARMRDQLRGLAQDRGRWTHLEARGEGDDDHERLHRRRVVSRRISEGQRVVVRSSLIPRVRHRTPGPEIPVPEVPGARVPSGSAVARPGESDAFVDSREGGRYRQRRAERHHGRRARGRNGDECQGRRPARTEGVRRPDRRRVVAFRRIGMGDRGTGAGRAVPEVPSVPVRIAAATGGRCREVEGRFCGAGRGRGGTGDLDVRDRDRRGSGGRRAVPVRDDDRRLERSRLRVRVGNLGSRTRRPIAEGPGVRGEGPAICIRCGPSRPAAGERDRLSDISRGPWRTRAGGEGRGRRRHGHALALCHLAAAE